MHNNHNFHEFSSEKTNSLLLLVLFILILRTSGESNSGSKKVAKNVRIFAKIEKQNCKYLFCPPVFFNIAMSICTSFIKDKFCYKASYLLKLTNRDILNSILLYKLLKRGFGGLHFEHKIIF